MAAPSKTPVRAYGPAQLPSASATRYTVPAGKIAVIRQVHVINPTAGAVTFTVSIGADAAGTRLFSGRSLAAGAEFDHIGYWVLGPGEVIQANASAGTSLVMTVFGDEYGDFPDTGGNDRRLYQTSNDASSSITAATAVADASTPHTKGAWVELVAVTPFRARRVAIIMYGVHVSGASTPVLVDFGMGPAGSEVVLIPNINHGGTILQTGFPWKHTFGVDIPAGARLTVRCQSLVLSKTVACSVQLSAASGAGGGGSPASSVTTYGADLANSVGVTPATPGAINTEGAWTEIVAATSADHGLLNVSGGLAGAVVTASTGLADIGYGPAGSEVVLIPNMVWATSTGNAEDLRMVIPDPARVNLPAGTRLAVRIQANAITGTFKPNFCVHGYGALIT